MELRKKARDCEFGVLQDGLMLLVHIRKVDNERMRRRMLETDKLELGKAIQLCQLMEVTASDVNKLGRKSCNTQEGEAAVSSQKVHGRSNSRATNREMPRGTSHYESSS